jgi:hypothetical protein
LCVRFCMGIMMISIFTASEPSSGGPAGAVCVRVRRTDARYAAIAASLALALSAGLTSTAMAQQSTPPSAEAPIQAQGAENSDPNVIVVPGRRELREVVRDFVGDITEPAKDGQLARFDRRICAGVIGAENRAAQALIDRLSARAMSLNLQVGEPGCRANVLIVLAADANRFTPSFVEQNGALFGVRDVNSTRGMTALEQFKSSPRAVRWWHVTQTVTDRGQVLGSSDASGGEGSISGAQVARVTNAGRLRSGVRQDFNRVIIVIDARKAAMAPFPSLADYVAMVALAQIDPTADVSNTPTILGLFNDIEAGRPPLNGWTDWDQSYLENLYDAPRYAKSGRLQESAITDNMTKDLVAAPPPASAAPSTTPASPATPLQPR